MSFFDLSQSSSNNPFAKSVRLRGEDEQQGDRSGSGEEEEEREEDDDRGVAEVIEPPKKRASEGAAVAMDSEGPESVCPIREITAVSDSTNPIDEEEHFQSQQPAERPPQASAAVAIAVPAESKTEAQVAPAASIVSSSSKDTFFSVPSSKPARKSIPAAQGGSGDRPRENVRSSSNISSNISNIRAPARPAVPSPVAPPATTPTRPSPVPAVEAVQPAPRIRPQLESQVEMFQRLQTAHENIGKAHENLKGLVPVINNNRALINNSARKAVELKSTLLVACDPLSNFPLLQKIVESKRECNIILNFYAECTDRAAGQARGGVAEEMDTG